MGVGWNFHGVVVVVVRLVWFLECSSQIKFIFKNVRRFSRGFSTTRSKCTMRCSCIFVLSNFSHSNLKKGEKGKGGARRIEGGFIFSSFFFLHVSQRVCVCARVDRICAACDHDCTWVDSTRCVNFTMTKEGVYLRVYIFVVSRKKSGEGDMFDFASLGKDNCLRRSSFC